MAKRKGDVSADLFSKTEPENQQDEKAESREPVKVTYRIAPDVADRIDLAQVQLRQITGKRGHEMSKSTIVETALRIVFEELENEGEESRIAAMLSDS